MLCSSTEVDSTLIDCFLSCCFSFAHSARGTGGTRLATDCTSVSSEVLDGASLGTGCSGAERAATASLRMDFFRHTTVATSALLLLF